MLNHKRSAWLIPAILLVVACSGAGEEAQQAAENPCAAANVCNPCADNPCAENPCAANPCNPCADNPCADNPCNPCADNPCNPCADNPCNPCSGTDT